MRSIPCSLPRRLLIVIASLFLRLAMFAQVESAEHNDYPNLDRRGNAPRSSSPSGAANAAAISQAKAAREQAIDLLRSRVRNLRVDRDELLDTPAFVGSSSSPLTGAAGAGLGLPPAALNRFDAQDSHRAVKAFIDEYPALFGHRSDVISAARVSRDYVTAHNGLRTIVWQQILDDIPIFESTLQAHLTSRGELMNLASRLMPDPDRAAQENGLARAGRRAAPAISAANAVAIAARAIGEQAADADVIAEGIPQGAELRQKFRAPSLLDSADVHYVWLPMDADTLRLAWEVTCTGKTHSFMFRVVVDAQIGEVQVRQSLTEHSSPASYRVFTSDSPSPFSPAHSSPSSVQPPVVARTLVTVTSLNATASPNGWIDDGVTETRGNNADAHTDIDANNVADLPRPQGPGRIFDPALDLTQSPTTYRDAAVVNLFYWTNFMHDKLYELGFTEPAGNFQNLNFGRGGLGNDAVQADAQDGSGVNNANFSTPSDGSPGRMQMYVFSGPTPNRDGDLDAEIILHEYTHGLSNRLVGGGVGMSAMQSRGMGEGWSDFYAMSLLSDPSDNVNGNYASGGYSTYQLSGLTQNYYFGIRRYPYSTNLATNPLTLKDIDVNQASTHAEIPRSPITGTTATEVHNMGEVWCVTLWDARANLVNKYGAANGNLLMLQLVTDAMKLSPANPTFLQARDAILQADVVDTGGANRGELWAAFAKRGMGVSAYVPANSTTVGLIENFDLPDNLNLSPVAPVFAVGDAGGPFSPSAQPYTLINDGAAALTWTAAKSQSWFTLSATSGTLAPGASTIVTASLNANANTLPVGSFADVVTFTNVSSGKTQVRSFNVSVQSPRVSLFALDSDPGWTRTGEWAFGHPTGGGFLPFGFPDPSNGATGSNVFGINLSGNYAVTVAPAVYLTAGPFNLTGYANTRLQFQRWLNTDGVGFVNATIEVSRNNSTWTKVWDNGSGVTTSTAWSKVQHDIAALADNQATIYVRWGHQVTSSSAFALSGWNIDDVELLGQSGATGPVIVTQPVSQTANVGSNVSFTVAATGLPVPTYQWNFNGLAIPGATSATLALNNVQIINAGTYTVTVSNSISSVTSVAVTLSGTAIPPSIGTQPANITVALGQTAPFTVAATGNPPLGYQWRRNGFAIAGATNATLNIVNASRTDADYYDVLVGSGLSTTSSQAARLSVAPSAYPGVVAPDLAWDIQAEGISGGQVVAALADGRTYIAGSLTSFSGPRQTSIARINVDSTVDATFAPPEIDGAIRTIAIQGDGRLIIGGEFIRINGLPRNRIARLNVDGSLDATFAAGITVNGTVLALTFQPDGRLLVGGSFTGFSGSLRNFLVRLNPDGTIDPTYLTRGTNSTVNALVLQADGRLLVGGAFTSYLDNNGVSTTRSRVARLNVDGTLDGTFLPVAPNNTVNDLVVQTDGKVVIAGSFTAVGATTTGDIARLNFDGTLDAAYTSLGGAGFNGAVNALALQADGRVIAGGSFTSFAGVTINRCARLNTDGSRDTSFLTLGFNSTVNGLTILPSGKIAVAGSFSTYLNTSNSSTSRSRFARVNTNGTLDSGFSFTSLQGPGTIDTMLPLPGGKMLVTGFFTELRGLSSTVSIARLNADGSVDPTFNSGGSGANSNVYGAVLQPDGKIVITGFFTTYNGTAANNIARLNADGTLDPTFNAGVGLGGSSGYVLVVLPGGRIFVGGTFTTAGGVSRNRVAVFNGDGSLNTAFAPGTGASSTVYSAVAQPDGKILIGGNFTTYNGAAAQRIARLNANGTLDPTFPTTSAASSDVSSIALLPDGKVVIGGLFTTYAGTARTGIARLTSTGALDATFTPPSLSSSVYNVLAQEDGKVVLRGAFNAFGGAANTAYLARLNSDGTRDASFAAAGFMDASLRPSVMVMRDNGQLVMQSNGYAVMSATQPAGPPTIITPPSNQVAAFGGSAAFSVAAGSVLPLTYQWLYNGNPIVGATTSTLTLVNLQIANTGNYGVTVTNEFGSTPSTSASLTVNKAAATVALSNLTQTYSGAAHVVGVSTTPAGLTVMVTYNGSTTPPVNAGNYAVVATVDDPNYLGVANGTLVVARAAATIALGPLNAIYDGTAKSATATTTPANLNVAFSYDGSPSAPTNAGSYTVVGTIVETNYAGTASGTFVIAKAAATIALGGLSRTFDGTPKPATAVTTPLGLNVAFTYNGSATAPTNAGSFGVVATIAENNYSGTASGTLTISPATAAIALSNLLQSYDGSPKSVTVTTTPAALAFSLTYDGSVTPPTNPGAYAVAATITNPNYAGSAAGILNIVTNVFVRHMTNLDGGIDGSVQLVTGENVALSGNAWISGDLLVPGTPALQLNGQSTLAGVRDADGSVAPSNYTVALNGAVTLRFLVRRIESAAFPNVIAPTVGAGTRTVALDNDADVVADFASVANLTVSGSAGAVAVPPGTYGALTANGNSGFIFGVAGANVPAVYDVQTLTLNGNRPLVIAGPVVLTLANGVTLACDVGALTNPEWLTLRIANGGLTLDGNAVFAGSVVAPNGAVIINSNSTLVGSVTSDSLSINGNGQLNANQP